ncbi:MAG: AMP-binding protein [Novosphingobium sp.]
MVSIARCVRRQALRNPDRVALHYAGNDTSYGALWQRIEALAGLLAARGVGQGDRVALLMKNSKAFIEIAFAISHAGAVAVPINFRLASDEVDYILRDSGAALLFCDEELATWELATPQVIRLDAATQANAALLTADGAGAVAMADLAETDLMRIMYTSGTTDRPKGVMHSYANFYAKSADQIVELGLSGSDKLLVCGPLYHVGAFDLPGVAVLWAGGMLCIQREFDADSAIELIAGQGLTGAWLAPVMTSGLLDSQAARPRDVSSLRWVIGGGERTPEARIRAFAEAFPAARYIDAYGLTETCGGDTMMEPGREIEKIGSVGRPLSQVDVEIRDDAGEPVAAGEEGEICIRGGKVTQGYWNAPEKTAASFFGDWLRTGDVGYLDGEGFLYITDRKKDLIISGGENIASSEVERAIQELAGVAEVAVIAEPDPRWGERPVAHVVLHAGAVLSEVEIREHCRSRLAGFKMPDRVHFRTDMPRSASGKILKRELRGQAGQGQP